MPQAELDGRRDTAAGHGGRESPAPPASEQTSNESSGVTDGVRTRDSWIHNPALYQLSYGHRDEGDENTGSRRRRKPGARGAPGCPTRPPAVRNRDRPERTGCTARCTPRASGLHVGVKPQAAPRFVQVPPSPHDWGCWPLHCFCPGEQFPNNPADARQLVHVAELRVPLAVQVSTPLPDGEHCVALGAQTPWHEPLTHVWPVHAEGGGRPTRADAICVSPARAGRRSRRAHARARRGSGRAALTS